MDKKRLIKISDSYPRETTISVPSELGLFLRSPAFDEAVRKFGSNVLRNGEAIVNIVPPLPSSAAAKLGELLVELASSIDPSSPLGFKVDSKLPRWKSAEKSFVKGSASDSAGSPDPEEELAAELDDFGDDESLQFNLGN